jgi:APA family basic amino acid/polyamine antiporter
MLARTLGTCDIVLLVIGVVVGSGIFVIPSETIRHSHGFVGLALLVWLIGGVLSVLGALTYAEMSAMNPQAGGMYVFVRDAFGPLPAFLYGWVMFLVIGPGTVAALSVVTAGYVDAIIPLGKAVRSAFPPAMIVFLAIVNIVGTKRSANLTSATTIAKVAVIVALCSLLLVRGQRINLTPLWPAVFTPSLLTSLGVAMLGVLWAFEGWQWVTFAAGDTINPQRDLPKGLTISTMLIVAIYMLANLAYLAVLGPTEAANSSRIAAQAVSSSLGPLAGMIVAGTIVVAIFSAVNSGILAIPRLFFVMAQDRLFFRRLGKIHHRFGTPAASIAALCAVAIVYAITGTFEQLLTYVVFSGWIFYALAACAIFVFRRRWPEVPRPFRVPGYPITPALFIAAAAAIVINTVMTQPERAAAGLGIVASGIPAYYFWKFRQAAA